jgi:hypothetical protein
MNLFRELYHDVVAEAEYLIHQYEVTDSRLGRHVNHDPRNLNYAHPVLPKSAITTVQWTRRIPILDQGQLGSCTGNAATGVLGTDSAGRTATGTVTISAAGAAASHGHFTAKTYTLNEAFAVSLYELATDIDPYPGQYPPTDTGSDGPSVFKALQALGLVTGYTHAFSMDALNSALMAGPVAIGIEWLNSMFTTDANGLIVVDQSSGVAGGHELEVDGFDTGTGLYTIPNSWGTTGFGVNGVGYMAVADMTWLLASAQQGDVTVPVYAAVPAPPTPTPVPVPPVPVPGVIDAQTFYNEIKAAATAGGLS